MNPTVRQLEYFVAIADHGSFQAAARACFVTQPGLSAQLAQLENSLDVRLFERDRRTVLITEAGAELLPRARGILSEVPQERLATASTAQRITLYRIHLT